MHTDFPFASHCVLGGCAALICNQYLLPSAVHLEERLTVSQSVS